ncbi:MFS transporter [Terrabacter sp. GCM10028922]|uniref:MFS transporter n=1 Tax=Terrabacter sp. GCM10028922 TaxID=3273428 RepID=UPI0036132A8D
MDGIPCRCRQRGVRLGCAAEVIPADVGQERSTAPSGARALLAASGFSMIGQGAALTAMPLLAASVTRDPVAVSVVAASSYAAALLVGLPAGALVDRSPLRSTMVRADLLRVALLAALGLAIVGGAASIPVMTLAAFGLAVGACFFDPAAQAMVPAVVGRDAPALARVNGSLWTLDTLGRALVGPPLGAALFAVAAFAPFAMNAATFLVSAVILRSLPSAPPPPDREAADEGLWVQMRAGLSFTWASHALRWLALGMGAYNFGFNVAFSTLVLFVQDRLRVSEAGYGLLLSAMAVGGLAGGLLARRGHWEVSPAKLYACALAVQGLGWLTVALSPWVWVSGLGLAIVGSASTAVSVVGGTARQLASPDGMLGRITSATRVVGIGSAAVGAVVGGVVGRVLGVNGPIGIACLAMALATVALLAMRRAA